jgi:hypothetical protein
MDPDFAAGEFILSLSKGQDDAAKTVRGRGA